MKNNNYEVVGETAMGKELAYKRLNGSSLFELFFVTGGKVPDKLTGGWTDPMAMMIAGKAYLASTVKPEPTQKEVQKKAVNAAKNRPNTLKKPESK